MPQIEVTVNPAGESKIRTQGFRGPACQAASQFVERALGQVTERQHTSEFYLGEVSNPSVLAEGSENNLAP
jgi:hypothetical protein